MSELPQGEGSCDISSYTLPVNTPKRNFPGVQDHGVLLTDVWSGDESGTTETDSKTNPKDPGYTRINRMRTK